MIYQILFAEPAPTARSSCKETAFLCPSACYHAQREKYAGGHPTL